MATGDVKDELAGVISSADQDCFEKLSARLSMLNRQIADCVAIMDSPTAMLSTDHVVVTATTIEIRKTETARELVRLALDRDRMRPEEELSDESGKMILGEEFLAIKEKYNRYFAKRAPLQK
ncbi:MAG: hypothetical protein ABIR91_00200 [Candidatus Saccharimonadales bacterium]